MNEIYGRQLFTLPILFCKGRIIVVGNKIKDIMTSNCVTVSDDEHVYEVALKMKQHNIGFIPVVQGEKLVGVITDRDMVIRGIAEKKTDRESIRELMTTQLFTINENTTIDEAAKIMADQQIRRLPVIKNEQLIGVVAIGDLAVRVRYADEAGEALKEISQKHESISH